jgi:GNAT superfamily N-acetyltransferase
MYKELGQVTLKTGEQVDAGVIIGPDLEWAERIEELLAHKGGVWNWQNSQALRSDLGIEARFYVLHREGALFSNISTFEHLGVGHFGHVWTKPKDRRKGASSRLMEIQMGDFTARGGKALFLGTGFDSVPYHMYEKFGFEGIEPQSGYMDWYAESKDAFETAYFAHGEAVIEPLAWIHWPSSAALFLGNFPCVVRCAVAGLIGRVSTEGALLPLLRDEETGRDAGEEPRAVALRTAESSAVVGFAAWNWDQLWPDTFLLDIYCHPHYWDRAGDLLGSLSLPKEHRIIAYSDTNCAHKAEVLSEFGFRQTSTLKRWVSSTGKTPALLNVDVYEKLP